MARYRVPPRSGKVVSSDLAAPTAQEPTPMVGSSAFHVHRIHPRVRTHRPLVLRTYRGYGRALGTAQCGPIEGHQRARSMEGSCYKGVPEQGRGDGLRTDAEALQAKRSGAASDARGVAWLGIASRPGAGKVVSSDLAALFLLQALRSALFLGIFASVGPVAQLDRASTF